MDYQIPFPPFSSFYEDLLDPKNDLVDYFRMIQFHQIQNVMCYEAGISWTRPKEAVSQFEKMINTMEALFVTC